MIFGSFECSICHDVADPACIIDNRIVCEDCSDEFVRRLYAILKNNPTYKNIYLTLEQKIVKSMIMKFNSSEEKK